MSVLRDPQWRMDRTKIAFGTLNDPPDETAYWLTKTPTERLQAMELMREILYGEDYAAAGFQRVLEFAQLSRR